MKAREDVGVLGMPFKEHLPYAHCCLLTDVRIAAKGIRRGLLTVDGSREPVHVVDRPPRLVVYYRQARASQYVSYSHLSDLLVWVRYGSLNVVYHLLHMRSHIDVLNYPRCVMLVCFNHTCGSPPLNVSPGFQYLLFGSRTGSIQG